LGSLASFVGFENGRKGCGSGILKPLRKSLTTVIETVAFLDNIYKTETALKGEIAAQTLNN
jgi:hypothetical protein